MLQNMNGIPSLARTNLIAKRNMLQLILLIRDQLQSTLCENNVSLLLSHGNLFCLFETPGNFTGYCTIFLQVISLFFSAKLYGASNKQDGS